MQTVIAQPCMSGDCVTHAPSPMADVNEKSFQKCRQNHCLEKNLSINICSTELEKIESAKIENFGEVYDEKLFRKDGKNVRWKDKLEEKEEGRQNPCLEQNSPTNICSTELAKIENFGDVCDEKSFWKDGKNICSKEELEENVHEIEKVRSPQISRLSLKWVSQRLKRSSNRSKTKVVETQSCIRRCDFREDDCKCGPYTHAHRDDACEERCLPMFWDDRGVFPKWIPVLGWLFDPDSFPNTNKVSVGLGKVGVGYFDRTRKAWMGFGIAATVIAIFVTGFGFFALSTDVNTLRWTSWGWAEVIFYNNTKVMDDAIGSQTYDFDNQTYGFVYHVGLNALVIEFCDEFESNSDFKWAKRWFHCPEVESIRWENLSSEYTSLDLFEKAVQTIYAIADMEKCKDASISNRFGAILTFATLIFALIGVVTRIRLVADSNIQKVIGCIPDTIGVFTLAYALYQFKEGCYDYIDHDSNDPSMQITISPGFGYIAYWCCWIAQLIRVFIHYCTPVPDQIVRKKSVESRTSFNKKKNYGCCCKVKSESNQQRELESSSPSLSASTYFDETKSGNHISKGILLPT